MYGSMSSLKEPFKGNLRGPSRKTDPQALESMIGSGALGPVLDRTLQDRVELAGFFKGDTGT